MLHSWTFFDERSDKVERVDIRVKKPRRFVPIRVIRDPTPRNLKFVSTYNDHIMTTNSPYNNPINDSFVDIHGHSR